jgi:hypothetical protein
LIDAVNNLTSLIHAIILISVGIRLIDAEIKMEALLTPAEVAQLIRKPERTLGQWRYLGIGPRFIRTGRDVRYRPRDVERWLDEQSSEAA